MSVSSWIESDKARKVGVAQERKGISLPVSLNQHAQNRGLTSPALAHECKNPLIFDTLHENDRLYLVLAGKAEQSALYGGIILDRC